MPIPQSKEDFLKKYNLDPDSLEKAKLNWDELSGIYDKHCSQISVLEDTANYIVRRLSKLPQVHSLKSRVKNAEHLVEKIIRKKVENSTRMINFENYSQEITDLIGVRALHLFKHDWQAIHEFIENTFERSERPIAYVREGDPDEIRQNFEGLNCEVKIHPKGYRSVHYLVTSKPEKTVFNIEIQVRTIFEEGWSEIDHRIRYPYYTDNLLVSQLLMILNRLAGSADEMTSFVILMRNELNEMNENKIRAEKERDEAINELEISDKAKQTLKEQLSKSERVNPFKFDSGALAAIGKTLVEGIDFRPIASGVLPGIDVSSIHAVRALADINGMNEYTVISPSKVTNSDNNSKTLTSAKVEVMTKRKSRRSAAPKKKK